MNVDIGFEVTVSQSYMMFMRHTERGFVEWQIIECETSEHQPPNMASVLSSLGLPHHTK